jgi:hypothetical protein
MDAVTNRRRALATAETELRLMGPGDGRWQQ